MARVGAGSHAGLVLAAGACRAGERGWGFLGEGSPFAPASSCCPRAAPRVPTSRLSYRFLGCGSKPKPVTGSLGRTDGQKPDRALLPWDVSARRRPRGSRVPAAPGGAPRVLRGLRAQRGVRALMVAAQPAAPCGCSPAVRPLPALSAPELRCATAGGQLRGWLGECRALPRCCCCRLPPLLPSSCCWGNGLSLGAPGGAAGREARCPRGRGAGGSRLAPSPPRAAPELGRERFAPAPGPSIKNFPVEPCLLLCAPARGLSRAGGPPEGAAAGPGVFVLFFGGGFGVFGGL